MNNTHSNKEDYTPSNSNKVISRKTKPRSRSSFKQKGGDFSDGFAGLDIKGNNYCWLAASIQLLWSIKPFREFLLQPELYDIIKTKKINTSDDDERIFYEALDFYEANKNKNESEPDIFYNINKITSSFKEEHSKEFKNIILALSRVFQLYQENITKKTGTVTAIQVNKEVVFTSDNGSAENVMEILEKAGREAEKGNKSEIQRDSNEFLMYIFDLFGMSNNNELMKTISYYSKTYSTVTVTKEDRINTFNKYLDEVKLYKYEIIEYDANTPANKINNSSVEAIDNMIIEAKKLINEQEINGIFEHVKALTKEDTPDTENKKIIHEIQKIIFKSNTETTDPEILEQLIVDKKAMPNTMENNIKLLLMQNKTIATATAKRDQLNNLLEFIIKKMNILTLLEKYNNISLLTGISNFATNIFMIIKGAPSSDDQTKIYTMQELVDIYRTTSHIIVPIESKYILIKREPTTTPMNKTIAKHKKIKIGNISYKLYGCISYSGRISSGHYYYIAFHDDDDSLLELNDSRKTLHRKDDDTYNSKLEEIQINASIYLYEKEEVLVNATEEDLAASTLALVATAILAQPQVTANAEAKQKAREAAKKNKETLDRKKQAAIDAENSAQETAEGTRSQQQQQEAERIRLQQQEAERTRLEAERTRLEAERAKGRGVFKKRQVQSEDKEEAEDNNEDEPTDPYRYAESPDYGSSAENIVLGTLLCITIIISTVMLSK